MMLVGLCIVSAVVSKRSIVSSTLYKKGAECGFIMLAALQSLVRARRRCRRRASRRRRPRSTGGRWAPVEILSKILQLSRSDTRPRPTTHQLHLVLPAQLVAGGVHHERRVPPSHGQLSHFPAFRAVCTKHLVWEITNAVCRGT